MRKIVWYAVWIAVAALWAAWTVMLFVKGEAWLMAW